MGLIYSVLCISIGGFLAYAGQGGLRAVGIVVCCGALLAIAELVTAMAVGRREERVYRNYDGP